MGSRPVLLSYRAFGLPIAPIAKTVSGTQENDIDDVRPETTTSEDWPVLMLNSRFARFPQGVQVKVNVRSSSPATRIVNRCADRCDYYVATGQARTGDVDVDGAKGTIRLNGSVPALVRWWVLPSKELSSLNLIGGNVRVMIDDECYFSSKQAMRDTSIWTNTKRIEVHITPDPEATFIPDPARTTGTINDQPLADLVRAWGEELSAKLPKEIKNLQRASKQNGDLDAKMSSLTELFTQLAPSLRQASRGARRGALSGQSGEFSETRSMPGIRKLDAGVSRRFTDRIRARRDRRRETPCGSSTAPVVDAKLGATIRASGGVVAEPPHLRWVNKGAADRAEDLTTRDYGYYVAGSHTVVLNAGFEPVRGVVDYFADLVEKKNVNTRELVRGYILDVFEYEVASLVVGNLVAVRGDKRQLGKRLTPEVLSVAGWDVRRATEVSRQILNKKFAKGTIPAL